MTIKASMRAALILATGIWICLSGASQAATATDNSTAVTVTKHGSHHLKKYAHHKPSKVADTTADDKKATADSDNPTTVQSSRMPASVANANAQLPSFPDTPAGSARAMTDRANNMLQATPDDAQAAAAEPVVAADQLNDVDRALHEGAPTAAPVMLASADAPAVVASPPAAAASPGSQSSIWDQTSLIGKIFIGFGALLTMASAARMFMA
ncbi:MAG: hypothetical protein KGK01_09355 [Bradyrhizobium sp.]|uniref:hypothetical protein n=1 Tax=Bradyrhizobium sp. TaxID=376 RepID=UPI001C29432F|nr:hypothetical protein [Bradyrhizobium sp.]MBU6462360.1 hypothetical protein [Pseudomonadota bacterium]MDE2067414.1 hypothetical protein [Bradyrhizobium sp.]MDE2242630.1 hypothetical protein [Bradyrhizobium sp.]